MTINMKPVGKLLRWYDRHGRKLPWRRTRNPYFILVSELMLQQTQVERVRLFYKTWIQTFPNWKTLAWASNGSALRAWAGLGYNRRAVMLRDAARHVVKHGIPKTEEGWRTMRGIGSYTAKAIMAFAFDELTMPIDTNIRRVGARLWFSTASDDARIERAGMKWIGDSKRARDVPQALFDLATAYCAKVPDCANCPMRLVCPSADKFLGGRVRVPRRGTPKPNERIQAGKRYPDRIYRGRILKHLQSLSADTVVGIGKAIDPTFMKHDRAWVTAMIARLQNDGMVRRSGAQVSLEK